MVSQWPYLMTQVKASVHAVCIAVCCGVRGRPLASHTEVRAFEPQYGGILSSLTCWQL